MVSKRITLADVAVIAGVSPMTVSNVINNHPNVSRERRQRVEAAIQSSGYVANIAARGLAGGRTNTIGVFVQDLYSPHVTEIVRGVAWAAEAAGYQLLVATTRSENLRDYLNSAESKRGFLDGICLLVPRFDDAMPEHRWQSSLPTVLIQPQVLGSGFASVRDDGYRGARMACEHLLALGHRRIAFVSGKAGFSNTERFQGYRDALSEAGVIYDETLVQPGDFEQQPAFMATQLLLNLAVPPTAIFAANDPSAFGVLDAIQAMGLCVPRDVSVVGFDDHPGSSQTQPALTTVRQPMMQMGMTALGMLERMGAGEQVVDELVLPTELIVRHSTIWVR